MRFADPNKSEDTERNIQQGIQHIANATGTQPPATETNGDIISDFRQLYGPNGMIKQAAYDMLKLRDLGQKVEKISQALEAGVDLDRVLEELDKVEMKLYGKLRRPVKPQKEIRHWVL